MIALNCGRLQNKILGNNRKLKQKIIKTRWNQIEGFLKIDTHCFELSVYNVVDF